MGFEDGGPGLPKKEVPKQEDKRKEQIENTTKKWHEWFRNGFANQADLLKEHSGATGTERTELEVEILSKTMETSVGGTNIFDNVYGPGIPDYMYHGKSSGGLGYFFETSDMYRYVDGFDLAAMDSESATRKRSDHDLITMGPVKETIEKVKNINEKNAKRIIEKSPNLRQLLQELEELYKNRTNENVGEFYILASQFKRKFQITAFLSDTPQELDNYKTEMINASNGLEAGFKK